MKYISTHINSVFREWVWFDVVKTYCKFMIYLTVQTLLQIIKYLFIIKNIC